MKGSLEAAFSSFEGTMSAQNAPFFLPEDRYKRRPKTDLIVIHCAATRPSWQGGAEEIRKWHLARGWIDIGYHFVIRRDGLIERGRPIWAEGAHVAGYNDRSVGICMAGGVEEEDGKTEENNFTVEQWGALRLLGVALKMAFYPEAEFRGHRDFPGVTKFCPSFDVKTWWEGMPSEF